MENSHNQGNRLPDEMPPHLRVVTGDKLRPIKYPVITSAELAEMDLSLEYFIDHVLVSGQPLIVAGPQKSMKTSMAVDLAISLATGGMFFGYFKVNRPVRVAIMSGESGLAVLRETASRICEAAGISLEGDCSRLSWCDRLPVFRESRHHDALKDFVKQSTSELVIIDPAYLCMDGEDAGNLFKQGEELRAINTVLSDAGAQLVLCHHTRKNRVRPHDPIGLEDFAWAGFQEFARQWMFINRREPYEHGTGMHRLWFGTGGSAGHGGLWGVDIDEGNNTAAEGRQWCVSIDTAAAARQQARETQTREKDAERRQEQQQKMRERKNAVLDLLKRFPEGTTKTTIRDSLGFSGQIIGPLLIALIDEKQVIKFEEKKRGKYCDFFKLGNTDTGG